jgi:hypothetical protein
MASFGISFPWNLVVLAIVAVGWAFGRWRGVRMSLSGFAISLGGLAIGIPVAHFARIDGAPLLILAPLATGFGAAALKNWIASIVVAGAVAMIAISFGEIVVLAVGCWFNSSTCP